MTVKKSVFFVVAQIFINTAAEEENVMHAGRHIVFGTGHPLSDDEAPRNGYWIVPRFDESETEPAKAMSLISNFPSVMPSMFPRRSSI